MADGSPTRFTHQLRDQGLHILMGCLGTLPTAFYGPWWACLVIAGLWATLREGEQWGKLNTPSVWDSSMDWSFVLAGSQLGWWTVHWLR